MVDKAANDDGLDIFAEFDVQDDGVWVPYKGDVEFLIARANNPKYRRRLSYFYEKNKRLLDGKGDAAEAKSNEIMATVMGETILLGWKDLQYKGKDLEYSRANAKTMLEVKGFRKRITDIADKLESFRIKDEVEQGNV